MIYNKTFDIICNRDQFWNILKYRIGLFRFCTHLRVARCKELPLSVVVVMAWGKDVAGLRSPLAVQLRTCSLSADLVKGLVLHIHVPYQRTLSAVNRQFHTRLLAAPTVRHIHLSLLALFFPIFLLVWRLCVGDTTHLYLSSTNTLVKQRLSKHQSSHSIQCYFYLICFSHNIW